MAADEGLHGHVPLRQPALPARCLLGWLLGGLRAELPAGKLKWNSPEVLGKKSPALCQSRRDSPQQNSLAAGSVHKPRQWAPCRASTAHQPARGSCPAPAAPLPVTRREISPGAGGEPWEPPALGTVTPNPARIPSAILSPRLQGSCRGWVLSASEHRCRGHPLPAPLPGLSPLTIWPRMFCRRLLCLSCCAARSRSSSRPA